MKKEYVDRLNEAQMKVRAMYLPGAIEWADKTLDDSWTKAVNEFDRAYSFWANKEDDKKVDVILSVFLNRIGQLISLYKESKLAAWKA